LITDFGEEKTWDLSSGDAGVNNAQGIACAEICADHVLTEKSYVSKITVPQHPDATDYTNGYVYLVIYGDTTGNDNWVFVGHSKSPALQQVGGEDMVFEFENDTDIGLYKKYRFFYVTSVSTTPQMPVGGANYNGVKMAFPAGKNNNDACRIMQSNGEWVRPYTFPATISYTTKVKVLHKDNEEKHVTQEEKTLVSDIKKINYLEVEDVNWSNVETATGAANIKSMHFSRNHFIDGKLGKITSIKIPTSDNSSINNNAVWLAVQLFKNNTAVGDVIYSDNTQTKTIAINNSNTYDFIFNDNELILTDYDVIKMAMVEDKNVTFNPTNFIPNNTVHQFRIKTTTGHTDNICCAYDSNSIKQPWLIGITVEVLVNHEYIHTPELHITPEERERWNAAADRIAELEATIATLTTQLTQLTAQN
jgi:hypothetical protein